MIQNYTNKHPLNNVSIIFANFVLNPRQNKESVLITTWLNFLINLNKQISSPMKLKNLYLIPSMTYLSDGK